MSPRLKRLSAREVLAALRAFDFEIIATRGSHAKSCRELSDGSRQILTLSLYRELAPETLRAIFRQATRFIPAVELHPYFFTDQERRQREAPDLEILNRDSSDLNREARNVREYQEDE